MSAAETTTTPVRPAPAPLIAALAATPFKFDFFQAVRRLECAFADRPRVGRATRASEEVLRFGQVPSLSFAPSTVAAFQPAEDDKIARMAVHFFGLLGPNGPMPSYFTEYVRDRALNQGDSTLSRFLDIFHHRMISLFYRAWACNQPNVNYDRPDEDRFGVYVASLFGLGMPSFLNRDKIPDGAKLYYAGRLSCQTRHAEGLESIVEDYFGVETTVEQFVGQWLAVPQDAGCRLGDSPASGTLGQTIVVGARVWECTLKFRIRLGPMTLTEYQGMLPGGNSLARLVDWVRNYSGDELEWDARLVLKQQEVPPLRLGKIGQLGWTTWLHSQPATKDADDLVLRPQAAA